MPLAPLIIAGNTAGRHTSGSAIAHGPRHGGLTRASDATERGA
jgi:hypothetical protein